MCIEADLCLTSTACADTKWRGGLLSAGEDLQDDQEGGEGHRVLLHSLADGRPHVERLSRAVLSG